MGWGKKRKAKGVLTSKKQRDQAPADKVADGGARATRMTTVKGGKKSPKGGKRKKGTRKTKSGRRGKNDENKKKEEGVGTKSCCAGVKIQRWFNCT